MVIQSRGHTKVEPDDGAKLTKVPSLTHRSSINRCFFVFHALFFFSLYNLLILRPPEKKFTTFSTEGGSTIHFANTIRPYTTFKMINRGLVRKNYLNATGLSNDESRIMKHFVHDYLEFHKKNRHTNARRLVFSPSGTGIGDRFRCLLFAYWAAVVSNRVFLVAWDDPFPVQEVMVARNPEMDVMYDETWDKPQLIKTPKGEMVPDVLSITGADLDRFENVMASNIHTVFINTNKVPRSVSDVFLSKYMPPDMTIRTMNFVRQDDNFFRAVLHQVFRLSNEMEKDIGMLSEKMELKGITEKKMQTGWMSNYYTRVFGKRKRPYIGVHARIGKGVGEGMSRFEKVSAKMEIAARCLASRAIRLSHMSGNPALPIFLATDTAEFRDVFKAVVKKMSHGRIEVVTGEWDIVHSNRLKNRRHDNGTAVDDADNRSVIWSTVIDLVMLGYAEHILALYSSFPRLAAYMGDAETITELRNEICLEGEHWR